MNALFRIIGGVNKKAGIETSFDVVSATQYETLDISEHELFIQQDFPNFLYKFTFEVCKHFSCWGDAIHFAVLYCDGSRKLVSSVV
jgi:hypothetical protein